MPRGRVARPVLVRFWEQVSKQSRCWIWIGARDDDGYGQFTSINKKNNRAHRFSWEIHFGKIPKGLKVLHKCDNPPCVRPEHLFLGTDAINLADARQKGRLKVTGEDNSAAKLTEDDVRAIRSLRGMRQMDIAKKFGVSQFAIGRILNGKGWKHVR